MNNYDIINFILLALILAITIHIILKNINIHHKKTIKGNNIVSNLALNQPNQLSQSNELIQPIVNMIQNNPQINDVNTQLNSDNKYLEEINKYTTSVVNNPVIPVSDNNEYNLVDGSNMSWDKQYTRIDSGDIESSDNLLDDFFKEYVLYGRNKVTKAKLSEEEKKIYTKNYFNFRDKVWDSPNQYDNVVDNLAQIKLAQNEEHRNIVNDTSIKHLFDNLTVGNKKIDNDCEPARHNTGVNHAQVYDNIGFANNMLNKDMFVNDDEYIMNGQIYSNDVYNNNFVERQEPVVNYYKNN